MTTISSTLSALTLFTLFALGCGSAPDSASVAQQKTRSAGYGYEFPVDSVSSTPPVSRDAEAVMPNDRLAPELIRRVVRGAFPEMSACYEAARAKNASLAGRLTVRFVIGVDGHVTEIASRDESLADGEMVSCVVSAAAALEFPRRDRAAVTVVYPLAFAR